MLPLGRRLAGDLAGIEPGLLANYGRLIEGGYAQTFGAGRALEAARSSAANSAVAPAEVEARRPAVHARVRNPG